MRESELGTPTRSPHTIFDLGTRSWDTHTILGHTRTGTRSCAILGHPRIQARHARDLGTPKGDLGDTQGRSWGHPRCWDGTMLGHPRATGRSWDTHTILRAILGHPRIHGEILGHPRAILGTPTMLCDLGTPTHPRAVRSWGHPRSWDTHASTRTILGHPRLQARHARVNTALKGLNKVAQGNALGWSPQ